MACQPKLFGVWHLASLTYNGGPAATLDVIIMSPNYLRTYLSNCYLKCLLRIRLLSFVHLINMGFENLDIKNLFQLPHIIKLPELVSRSSVWTIDWVILLWLVIDSILLHSGLNQAWHFWLSTRFFCCLKMKSVESTYIQEQFLRGCKPQEKLWNC